MANRIQYESTFYLSVIAVLESDLWSVINIYLYHHIDC